MSSGKQLFVCPICSKEMPSRGKGSHLISHDSIRSGVKAEKNRQSHLGKKDSPKTKTIKSLAAKGKTKSPEHIQRVVEARRAGKGFKGTVEGRKRNSLAHLQMWKDGFYCNRQIGSGSPNRQEKLLTAILDTNFPDMWEFVGNRKFSIDGKCPDYIRKDGSKFIIEYFGSFWHASPVRYSDENTIFNRFGKIQTAKEIREKDTIRLSHLHELGWNSLVIWEHDLKNPIIVKDKVKEFIGGMHSEVNFL
jgi:G:T-mismatch repair DNA endonuclease (very short patch repair protein)